MSEKQSTEKLQRSMFSDAFSSGLKIENSRSVEHVEYMHCELCDAIKAAPQRNASTTRIAMVS